MIEWIALSAALFGAAGIAVLASKRSRSRSHWRRAFESASTALGGRVSLGATSDAPELRAEIDGRQVQVRARGEGNARNERTLSAETALLDDVAAMRLVLEAGTCEAQSGFEHIPAIEFESRDHPHATLRADDPNLARRCIDEGGIDLFDAEREAGASGIRLVVRGGHLALTVFRAHADMRALERLARVAVRLASIVERVHGGGHATSRIEPLAPSARATLSCTLCASSDARSDGTWVRCARCSAPYHAACFRQATGCVAQGCDETHAIEVLGR